MIICKECKQLLPHGAKGLCYNCYQRSRQKIYSKRPEGIKAKKEYLERNKEKIAMLQHEYYLKHQEELKQYGRDYWKRKKNGNKKH